MQLAGSDGRQQHEVAAEAMQYSKTWLDSRITDSFQGWGKSTLSCTNCQHESYKFDSFMCLSLPLPLHKLQTGAAHTHDRASTTAETAFCLSRLPELVRGAFSMCGDLKQLPRSDMPASSTAAQQGVRQAYSNCLGSNLKAGLCDKADVCCPTKQSEGLLTLADCMEVRSTTSNCSAVKSSVCALTQPTCVMETIASQLVRCAAASAALGCRLWTTVIQHLLQSL